MSVNATRVGDGQVVLIAGGGRVYTDTAARFCRSEKDLKEIIATPESKALVHAIIESRHYAAMEFDNFIFGIQGYARVTEVQLVRKRMASYLIKSGRVNKAGKRSFDMVIPDDIKPVHTAVPLDPAKITLSANTSANGFIKHSLAESLPLIQRQFGTLDTPTVSYDFDYMDILQIIDYWYSQGVEDGVPEENLRYMKPQATEFKALIGMNAHALRDWFMIRMCNRAQFEIRDLATKMHRLASEVAPELFEGSGPSCKVYGYCPELEQCKQCRGKIPTKAQALALLQKYHDEAVTT